jgi:hypothetical protein
MQMDLNLIPSFTTFRQLIVTFYLLLLLSCRTKLSGLYPLVIDSEILNLTVFRTPWTGDQTKYLIFDLK